MMNTLRIKEPKIELNETRRMEIARSLFPKERQIEDLYEGDENIVQVAFTMEELKTAAERLKNNKAPGMDRIPPEAIKAVVKGQGESVLRILNNVFGQRAFPTRWKEPTLY